jgi:glycosyltransferase involved in cell wall biosynthesis
MPAPKICHLTSVHSATDPRIFYKECRSLARAGFAVAVVGAHPCDAVIDEVQIKSIEKDSRRLFRMTRTVYHVLTEALKQNADIYHFHDPELIPVGLLLKARGKEVIYDIHEDLPKDILSKPYLPRWSRAAISSLMNELESGACRKFSALVVVTPSIAERFSAINDRTVVIHNYPYVRELMEGTTSAPLWIQRRQAVAYVGGITMQRALREMVAAMAILPISLPATLELAGPEIISEADSNQVRADSGWKRVRHHGFIDQPSTFRILQNVRAGLVLFHPEPNHLEAMPQKIFEYMGAGLPVIASDFPLWKRIIGSSGCGIFVNPMKPAEIAGAIEYVLTHPDEAEEMGKRGQAAVMESFNWDSESTKLVNLYRELSEKLCAA